MVSGLFFGVIRVIGEVCVCSFNSFYIFFVYKY